MPKSKLFVVPKEPTQRPQAPQAPEAPNTPNTPNNLPVELGRIIGREKEVEAVRGLLSQPNMRLLTLVGPGGVGKTRLALQLAWEMLEQFEDGVHFVELAAILEADLVVPTIATTLQVREAPGASLLSTLKSHLLDKRILLVLDNFEQVISAGPALAELLAMCPNLKLLVTSRAAIGLRSEQQFAVSPLAIPNTAKLREHQLGTLGSAELLRYGAIELFAQRASTIEFAFKLTDDNAEAVIEVCRRVDGLTLAIELVAAHTRLLSPQSILARLTQPLRLLTGGPLDAPGRHRTMRDTIEWSYRLLGEGEQRLFRRLSVFVGGFSVRVAEAVCNEGGDISIEADDPRAIEVLEGLEALVAKSLVRRVEQGEDEDKRLAMLETVRAYAWEQLVESDEGRAQGTAPAAQAMRRRHADYYLWLAERAEPGLEAHDTAAWLDQLDRDHDNLRAALGWLLEQGQTETAEEALRLLVSLRVFWDGRAHFGEHVRWLEKALTQIGDEVTPMRSRALRRGSIVARKQGDYPRARAWAEQAVAMARELGDKRQITDALNALAAIELVQGDYSAARSLMEETLAAYRELGVDVFIASTLNNLGEVARYQSDYTSAEGYYRESLGIFRAMGDQTGIIESVGNWGHSLHQLGKFQEARAAFLEAMALAQEINAPTRAAAVLTGLSGVILSEIERAGAPGFRGADQVARLCGLAAGLLEGSGRPLEQLEQARFDSNVAAARARLGAEVFNRAWEEGRAMTLDRALQLATQATYGFQGPGSRKGVDEAQRLRKRGSGGLTSREYEVVRFVTQGLSNEEIASRLVLSERTVETHVSNALHKLGLTTRTQLATWAVDQGIAPVPTQN
jgi:predicted ATPase/DNA-binding CsgD family transcriptional regulator/Tfp pilus assembly protein PilF